MNLDLKSAAIGLALGLVVCGGWYAGSTRPVIQRLVEEKAQATGRANQLDQEKTQYKTAAEHWFAVSNSQTQQVAPQDPAVAMLNAVKPGLGTIASQLGKSLTPAPTSAAATPNGCPSESPIMARNNQGKWECFSVSQGPANRDGAQ